MGEGSNLISIQELDEEADAIEAKRAEVRSLIEKIKVATDKYEGLRAMVAAARANRELRDMVRLLRAKHEHHLGELQELLANSSSCRI